MKHWIMGGIFLYLTLGALIGLRFFREQWGQEDDEVLFGMPLFILFWPLTPLACAFGAWMRSWE